MSIEHIILMISVMTLLVSVIVHAEKLRQFAVRLKQIFCRNLGKNHYKWRVKWESSPEDPTAYGYYSSLFCPRCGECKNRKFFAGPGHSYDNRIKEFKSWADAVERHRSLKKPRSKGYKSSP